MFEHLFTLTSKNFRALVAQQFLWVRIPHGYYMEDNRSLDEIYEAICTRIRELYVEQGIEISDEEMKKAADNLLRFCNQVIEINVED